MAKRTLTPARGVDVPDVTRRAFELKALGIKLSKAPTFEEWEALGGYVAKVHGAAQWWVGDWLNIGEERFGEQASQAMDLTGWELETLLQYRRVCEAVPLPRRVPELSFSHHREVMGLTPKEQDDWLARALGGEDGVPWSAARLRREINHARRSTTETTLWALVSCKSPSDQQDVVDRLRAEGRECKAVERKVTETTTDR